MRDDRTINIIELPSFTKKVQKILTTEEYYDLIELMAKQPEKGVIISGSGGLRKLRLGIKNKGTRGGARVIYYYLTSKFKIYLFTVYTKNNKDDLTKKEKEAFKTLIKLIKQENHNGG